MLLFPLFLSLCSYRKDTDAYLFILCPAYLLNMFICCGDLNKKPPAIGVYI